MNYSAPRVDSLISSPDSSQEQYAGQPQKDANNTWLARFYDRFMEKHGDDLEVIGIAGCGAMPSALAFALSISYGPFWAITITSCSVGFYAAAMSSVVGLRDKLSEVKDSKLYELCEARKDLAEVLLEENTQLQHDKAHLLCERGQLLRRLHVAEEAAAGELSCSENAKAPAAVVHLKPKGAGA